VYPQEITRALLNLISNSFYAATKRKERDNSDGHEPTLTAATKNLGDKVEIRIRDNGTGIPPEVREKMFNPFSLPSLPVKEPALGSLSVTTSSSNNMPGLSRLIPSPESSLSSQ
jgi:K+-sensing histidine kinase KdpD